MTRMSGQLQAVAGFGKTENIEMEKMNDTLKMLLDNLTDDQKEKAKTCKGGDELIAFLAKEGVELSDEIADMVAGGGPVTEYIYHVMSQRR